MKILLIAAAVALTAGTAAVAQDAPTRTVSYADLNLSSVAGRATLSHRIAGAARSVCADLLDSRDLATQRLGRTCRDQAKTTAFAALARSTSVQLAAR